MKNIEIGAGIGFIINTDDVIVPKTSVGSGSGDATYTAERNCCVVINFNISYETSGYGSANLNGKTVHYTTARVSETVSIIIGKSDTITITTNSQSKSYYTVYGLKS